MHDGSGPSGRMHLRISLSALLEIPADRQHEWGLFTQSQYSFLFPSERAMSSEMLARVGREFTANPRTSERIGE